MSSKSCLCPELSTYDPKCCKGRKHPRAFKYQGIGQLTGHSISSVQRYGREFSEDFNNDFK